jgi:hypothetical protein
MQKIYMISSESSRSLHKISTLFSILPLLLSLFIHLVRLGIGYLCCWSYSFTQVGEINLFFINSFGLFRFSLVASICTQVLFDHHFDNLLAFRNNVEVHLAYEQVAEKGFQFEYRNTFSFAEISLHPSQKEHFVVFYIFRDLPHQIGHDLVHVFVGDLPRSLHCHYNGLYSIFKVALGASRKASDELPK